MEEKPVLDDVSEHERFWTCNGIVICNVFELLNYLEGCNDHDFRYHVNNDHHKNDFSIWVREVIHDNTLAMQLDSELDKTEYIRKIKKRLRKLA